MKKYNTWLNLLFVGMVFTFWGCRTDTLIIDNTAELKKPFDKIDNYRGKIFLGISGKAVELPEDDRLNSSYGLEITNISVGSTADKAGLKPGDIIVEIEGKTWDKKPIKLYKALGLGKGDEQKSPGDSVNVKFLRSSDKQKNQYLVSMKFYLYPYPATKAELPRAPSNAELRPDLVGDTPDYQLLCEKLIKETGMEKDYRNLMFRLRRCEEFPDPYRLPIERYVHREPFKLEKITEELIEPFIEKKSRNADDICFFLEQVKKNLLDFGKPAKVNTDEISEIFLPDFKNKDLKTHLNYIEQVIKKAAEHHRNAFKQLTPTDIKHILLNRKGLFDAYLECRMLSYDPDRDRQDSYLHILKLSRKIDYNELFKQAEILSRLSSSEFCKSLLLVLEKSGKNLDSSIVVSKKTEYGKIIIAGRKRNRHKDNHAVIFDLGGEDVYAGNNASSFLKEDKAVVPSALIVDFAGDDAYETCESLALGVGDLGVGILVDKAGNDRYIGRRFTQGAGFMGIGVLVDEKGNDVYRCLEIGQGVGHFGAGILIDSEGNDQFEAHDTSQGVGLPGGYGLLYNGGTGVDSYYCKGNKPSGYGTTGVFEGWGQGGGIGYRPYASGGLGILLDCGGNDYFEAGNFCQGGGYFYGFGIFYNAGTGNDKYVGSRYAQGFACHQASGAFIEKGGDDTYCTRFCVAQGLSWDEASGLFIDESGDDRYEGGGFSQGASAMNGFIIFIDRAGKDTYLYTDQARAGGNSYHGGTSLSCFIDLGGDADTYSKKKDNNAIFHGKENFLFLDLPGSVTETLKNKDWKMLLRETKSSKKDQLQKSKKKGVKK